MDPFGIGSVDVARGPGSVAYGSDAFGGVISVQTPRPVIGGPWKARLSGIAGTGIPDRGGSAEIQKGATAPCS
jgi:outer membrane receptor protein involved in Fe transport